ncbi:hypothetical protein [Mycobacterium intracellulare]|uniref:hypothetical protein n=1 Tax=Mycobacterium intracellulare TaxID=1767 RepID=UPI0019287083|nr:hypothetical protein [Mycobacterium intracellulare]
MAGVVGFFLYEAIKASENVARVFGKLGKAIRNRTMGKRLEKIEEVLLHTSDKLECATSYLVIDADYHHQADMIVAENHPSLFRLLPKRMPFTEFSRMWDEGWRP